jgi:Zn finger protein HypA/HybF involved in hydrogenase expression
MHEFALATDIIDAALRASGREGHVTTVYVTLNARSHIDASGLSGAFEIAAAGTPLANATLDVVMTEGGRGVATVTAIDVEPEPVPDGGDS